jgi:hypothetical protein
MSPSPKGFQSPKFSDSDFREVRGLGLGRPKSSGQMTSKTFSEGILLLFRRTKFIVHMTRLNKLQERSMAKMDFCLFLYSVLWMSSCA